MLILKTNSSGKYNQIYPHVVTGSLQDIWSLWILSFTFLHNRCVYPYEPNWNRIMEQKHSMIMTVLIKDALEDQKIKGA